jgi:twitching motility protein PilT
MIAATPDEVPLPVAEVAAAAPIAEPVSVVAATRDEVPLPVAEVPEAAPIAEPVPVVAATPDEVPLPVAEVPAAAPIAEPAPVIAATPHEVALPVAEVATAAPIAQPAPSAATVAPRAARPSPPPPPAAVATPPIVAPVRPVAMPAPRVAAPTPKVAVPTPPVPTERPLMHAPATSAPPPRSAPVIQPSAAMPAAPPPSVARETPHVFEYAQGSPGVVLPIARSPIRSEQPPPMVSDPTLSGLERLLRLSAARGASTLYLSSGSRPSVRVDGELQALEGEPVLVPRDVQSLLLTLMPERDHEALRTGGATEWICELEGVGRVRCMSFRDHLGPGGVFRLMPTRSISADQLGLPRQVQALAIEPEGLVLVAGPRSSGKRTLMAAFVDLMNRTRRDHIITIEREINIVHERGLSFISQREVRGNDDDLLAAARGALREDPDVLVLEDLRTGPLMNVALEAAASGRLVIGGFSAHTATGAIDRIIDLYAPEYRRQVQMALADSLRGVIVQTLLRKIGGGRLPAREVLLNTPAVSSVIAEGKTSQLPMAIEGGRRYGMMPLNDTLVGLVQNGSVEAREAYRRSPDRPGFLAALDRHGLDTSFVERLA